MRFFPTTRFVQHTRSRSWVVKCIPFALYEEFTAGSFLRERWSARMCVPRQVEHDKPLIDYSEIASRETGWPFRRWTNCRLILTFPKTTQKNNRSRCRIYWQCGESSSRQRSIIHEAKQVPLRHSCRAPCIKMKVNLCSFDAHDSIYFVLKFPCTWRIMKKKAIKRI